MEEESQFASRSRSKTQDGTAISAAIIQVWALMELRESVLETRGVKKPATGDRVSPRSLRYSVNSTDFNRLRLAGYVSQTIALLGAISTAQFKGSRRWYKFVTYGFSLRGNAHTVWAGRGQWGRFINRKCWESIKATRCWPDELWCFMNYNLISGL